MAAISQNVISFVSSETLEVEAAMRNLSSRGDGTGWINIGPALTDIQQGQLPEPSMLGSWFAARGPIVPMGTWTPPSSGSRPRPVLIGVEHGVGPKALDQLREAGLPLPATWRKVQDNAKRGVVVEVPEIVEHRIVVDWLVSACWSLCGIDIDDHWSAVVNSPES